MKDPKEFFVHKIKWPPEGWPFSLLDGAAAIVLMCGWIWRNLRIHVFAAACGAVRYCILVPLLGFLGILEDPNQDSGTKSNNDNSRKYKLSCAWQLVPDEAYAAFVELGIICVYSFIKHSRGRRR